MTVYVDVTAGRLHWRQLNGFSGFLRSLYRAPQFSRLTLRRRILLHVDYVSLRLLVDRNNIFNSSVIPRLHEEADF